MIDAVKNPEGAATPRTGPELRGQKRGRNIAVLLAIIAFCLLFYVITIVRMF